MSADAEKSNPEEADANRCDADNAGGEEDQDNCEEDDVVDWEDLARENHQPVDGLEDLVVSKEISATRLAHAIFDLVNTCDEHRRPDEQDDYDEQKTTDKLEGSEDGFNLDPGSDKKVVTLSSALDGQTFTTHEGAFLTNQSVKLTSVPRVETTVATLVATLELALALTVLDELRRGRGSDRRSRDARSRFDEGQGQQRKTRSGVEAVQNGTDGDKEANAKGQGTLAVYVEQSQQVNTGDV